jgi:nicotinate-nucleotide--dimethylbenzimidazole phosphoribosyltransferase
MLLTATCRCRCSPAQQLELTVVDCGVAADLQAHDQLLMRKIAHGTRNARHGGHEPTRRMPPCAPAWRSATSLRGNVRLCRPGRGRHESAALVLSRLTDCPLRDLLRQRPRHGRASWRT